MPYVCFHCTLTWFSSVDKATSPPQPSIKQVEQYLEMKRTDHVTSRTDCTALWFVILGSTIFNNLALEEEKKEKRTSKVKGQESKSSCSKWRNSWRRQRCCTLLFLSEGTRGFNRKSLQAAVQLTKSEPLKLQTVFKNRSRPEDNLTAANHIRSRNSRNL